MNTKMRKEASKMPKHEKRPGVDRTPAELLGDLLTQLKFLRQEFPSAQSNQCRL